MANCTSPTQRSTPIAALGVDFLRTGKGFGNFGKRLLVKCDRQQLWAKMALGVVRDRASVSEAVDWAIAQIGNIWQKWEQ